MDVQEAIKAWKPCLAFQLRPIQDESLQRVLNAARFASSADNQQPWRFIVVRGEDAKRKLSQAVTKGHFLTKAPIVLVALGVEEASASLLGGYMLAYPLDVAASIQNLLVAATGEGLGSCWCTEFREDKIREQLELPEGVRVLGVLPLGYPEPATPGNNGGHAARKTLSEIVGYDTYSW
ncbi:MAG: nitroreductase family protein [Euryarchaeota archaeon]|nr:nitroreductase family protein [Euryarchaeota archaeon]MDE1837948.1 nitroreductase family protein [Euryarchaeota archaeon]MDE1882312.1 nitroreductase family protein [Euryarchaeota archaeon]MDE2046639.1 nitroreductase family protein [Thermoplasmata archaeon]